MFSSLSPEELQRLARELSHTAHLSEADATTFLSEVAASADAEDVPSVSHAAASADTTKAMLRALVAMALEQLRSREFMASIDRRPQSLACDVWRFQNKKEKWVAFVGLLNGRPYEIFTGLQDDEEGIVLPKSVNTGWIVKNQNADGTSRYDFSFQNRRGYKTTVEGLSARFNKEYWNYAKLISGVLRHGMPVDNVVQLIDSLQLENDTINTWKAGVVRALRNYFKS